jgi:hypothetical protein
MTKTFKTMLAALALAAVSTAAQAATEQPQDVTAAINNSDTNTTSLPSMQPAAGDTVTTPSDVTTNTTTPGASSTTNTVMPDSSAATNTLTNTTTASSTAVVDSITAEKMAARRLMEDQLAYTRNYIISEIGGLRDTGAVQDRLMKNQDDMSNMIKGYYGDDAGTKLSSLLHDSVNNVVGVVQAAKGKNQKALSDAQAKATGTADEIASFFANVNTNLNKDDVSASLHKQLDFITAQANARVKKDWKSDIDAYDQGEDEALKLSDMMVDAIAKQYPDKFSNAPSTVQPSSGP